MRVIFFFDPACPWCWMTSRWVVEAQKSRDISITWKPFSLEIKNTGVDVPSQYRPSMRLGLRALRIIEAAKAEGIADMESIGNFYSALGQQIHNQGLGAQSSIIKALESAQWPTELHYHENSEQFDIAINTSMQEGIQIAGTSDIGIPLIVLDGENPTGFFGPIVSPTPKGDQAATLWDSFLAMANSNNFYEVKKLKKREVDFS